MAIGARLQAARTYPEKHFESFGDLSKDEPSSTRSSRSARPSAPAPSSTSSNAAVAFVSADDTLTILEDEAIALYVEQVKRPGDGAPAAAPAAAADAPMATPAIGAGAAIRTRISAEPAGNVEL